MWPIRNPRQVLSAECGQALIQVLVSTAILGIIILTTTAVIEHQSRETRALGEALGARDLERTLIAALADGSVCNYILNNPSPLTFDSTNVTPTAPQTITLPGATPAIYASILPGTPPTPGPIAAQVGSTASAFSSSLIVKSIKLSITSGTGNIFVGNWIVDFDNTKTVRGLHGAAVSTILTVDLSAPTAARITNCAGTGTSFQAPVALAINSVQVAPCNGFVMYFTGGNGITGESAYFCQGTDSAKVSECYGYNGGGPGAQTIFSRVAGYNGSMSAVKMGYYYQVQYLGPLGTGGGGLYDHGTPAPGSSVVAKLICLD